jgi:hypothetical protein
MCKAICSGGNKLAHQCTKKLLCVIKDGNMGNFYKS